MSLERAGHGLSCGIFHFMIGISVFTQRRVKHGMVRETKRVFHRLHDTLSPHIYLSLSHPGIQGMTLCFCAGGTRPPPPFAPPPPAPPLAADSCS